VSKPLTITIPHRLTQDEARMRLQNGIADLKTKHAAHLGNMQEQWDGNRMTFALKAAGQSVSGRLEVLPEAVKLEVDLPWLVAVFAEKFRPRVEEEGRKLLEKK
jgi:hypothetical protein